MSIPEENKGLYIKQNVKEHEYKMHKLVYELKIVNTPKIISYDKTTKTMVMEKIDNMNLSDMYGEDDNIIDEYYFDEIRTIIKKLAENNIEYPDITGYNFIEHDNKIWIIDFEHSSIFKKSMKDPFVNKFIAGLNKWNPEFK
jgi:tRNA A-37 threonylcarbamoyl transferase component Bud32